MQRFHQVIAVAMLVPACMSCNASDANADLQVCLEALRTAAKNEYSIQDDKSLDTMFRDTFCDVVKHKLSSSSKSDASAAFKLISASVTNDQAQLSEYDRQYCRDKSGSLKFTGNYRLSASIVTGNPLTEFNACVAAVVRGRPASARGVEYERVRRDACYSEVKVAFRPTVKGPDRAEVESVHSYNVDCSTFPKKLTANFKALSCRKTTWGSGSLLGTTQEPVEIEFPAEASPPPPAAPLIPTTDSNTETFRWSRGSGYEPQVDCVHNGRMCTGRIILKPGAVIQSVVYACTGGTNENGHSFCGWSFGNKGAPDWNGQYAANWSPATGGAVWSRYWDGGASAGINESYTVTYTLPHVDTPEETRQRDAYDAALARHNDTLFGPCPKAAATQKR